MQSEIEDGYKESIKKNVRQQTIEGVGISWFRQTRKFKRGQIHTFDALDDQNLSEKRKGSSILTKKFNFWVQKAQQRSKETARQISLWLCLIQPVKLFLIMGLTILETPVSRVGENMVLGKWGSLKLVLTSKTWTILRGYPLIPLVAPKKDF